MTDLPSILITDCMQVDFVGPVPRFASLPNTLHVGHDESLRLLGDQPAEGPVSRMIAWAHAQPDDLLKVIHVRDWHDPADPEQREHLDQFGHHCIRESAGARFVFPVDNLHAEKRLAILDATTLSNFIGPHLERELAQHRDRLLRVGLMGVWTEAKITFLAYDLRSRYPGFRLAVCSALTASSSRENHFIALDQLERILGVQVIPSVGEFIEYLGGRAEDAPLIGFNQKHPELRLPPDITLRKTDHQLIRYLFRGCREVAVRVLDGGFSGNIVMGTRSVDLHGHEEVPHVVKIGAKIEIGKERVSFERIEAVLGNSAPRIADFADFEDRGAIKYRYAAVGRGESRSFQKLYEAGADDAEVARVLDCVFLDQLGRFYQVAAREKCDLLQYYDFKYEWASSVSRKVGAILGAGDFDEHIAFPNGKRLPSIVAFYKSALANLPRSRRSHYFSYVHGDLNGANIIVDGQTNVWLIDFFHTHRGHVLKDLLKLENDLLYIFTKIRDENDLLQAMHLSDLLVAVGDLGKPLPPLDEAAVTNEIVRRAYRHVQLLRKYYPELIKADREPMQWLIGHIRYAVHTLGFDESTLLQKRWALYSACLAAERLAKRASHTEQLRIDWLPDAMTAPGRVGITIAPGRADWERSLTNDLAVLRDERIDCVVCLLTNDEFRAYGIDNLLERYQAIGLEVRHVPVLDGHTPESQTLAATIDWLASRLAAGKAVLVHCAGGLGRAGTVAACFLRTRGLDADAAMALTRRVRSPRAIETEIQEKTIREFPGTS